MGSEARPQLSVRRPRGTVTAVALVLHGGAERGQARMRYWRAACLRMVPIARALSGAGRAHGVAVWLLRNRVRGWNEPDLDPVRDARWALARIRAEHPGLPVVLIGHSMGGRVALRVADDPAVAGVCALAPWTPPRTEPVAAVRGKAVLIVHGVRDRMTDPAGSYSFASRAEPSTSRLVRFELSEEGHAMLRRPGVWTRLVCAFTLDILGARPADETLTEAWAEPSPQRLRIQL
ncbi:alpha/beta hydrolase [Amycolatopsis nigrescens]|uniref:alpha/beta hydrolase n=1 Tax=Amycolatopsis nigrescens TaxID=381445 RepID=UPI00037551D3|nr:alpha/beta fold hydrolase [Amycolatopsis nigrescens]